MPPVKKGVYGPRGDRSDEYTFKKAAYMKEWRRKNRDKVNAYNRKSYANRRFHWRALKRIKNFSEDIYNKALEKQKNLCAICGEPFKKTPQSDHNHETQEFRGLLCTTCNTGIGKFRDNPSLLTIAAGYCAADGNVHASSKRFYQLLGEIALLHSKKQKDYGRGDDPFANVRASKEWGVHPWIGAMIRLTDKVRRLQSYAEKGSLANEGVDDSLRDIAVYALIALVLFEQEQK